MGKLAESRHLSMQETEAAFTEIMDGLATPVQIGGLLMGLRAKGETAGEVAGGVRALQRAMVSVPAAEPDALVDTCGTGGGALTTFNISTAAAFVVAAGGVPVAKHGNRSFSSRCGSADVLEALGITLPLTPQRMSSVLSRVGLSFLFAPRLHPAMAHVAPVRRELAVPTIMNLLGPLTNPAGARRQVVGVSDPRLLPLVADALAELGHIRALVVHGEPGVDELSPLGRNRVLQVEDGDVESLFFDPATELGWNGFDPEEIAGGEPAENAALILEVFGGGGPPAARAAVALNAAGGFYVAERVESLREGVELAETMLAEGGALEVLESLRAAVGDGQ